MIPLRDNVARERKPLVVWTITALCALIFFYELTLPERGLTEFLYIYGVVPARFTNPHWAAYIGFPEGGLESFVTYMFLHGGWLHFLLNMWVFWIFADNIEDVLGHFKFTVFYLFCGLAALAAHILFNSSSTLPVVGASGAVAGVMGAYLRLFPHARVTTVIPIFIFPLVFEVPAGLFLGFWFFIQLFSGLFDSMTAGEASNVAFWAHAGGFLAGMSCIRLFGVRNCRYCYDPKAKRYDID